MTIVWVILGTAAAVIIGLNLFGTAERKLQHAPDHIYRTSDPQFMRAMGTLLGPSLLEGNRVSACYNGDQIFPAMLGAIRAAEKTITFETYIYWSGEIGREFAEALSERARAGVKVHVLLDWVGSGRLKREFLKDMEEAGVEICRYHPPTGTRSRASTTERTASSWSSTAGSGSRAASGSRQVARERAGPRPLARLALPRGLWVSVGSTNFDNRSFRLNDEANLNVLDGEFAAEQIRTFERDLGRAREVTLEEWKNRPHSEKAKEFAAGLLRSQL